MSTEKNSFFLQFQLLLDAYQQRSHIKTSHRVMQQYRWYYCPKEFQSFSETIDHTCIYHQDQKIKIKIVKTSECLFGCLCWGRSGIVLLKPTCWNRPVITYAHLSQVVRFAKSPYKKMWTPRAQRKRLVRKRNVPLYIPHRRDLKRYSQNAYLCMCSLWPWPLTHISDHEHYMN